MTTVPCSTDAFVISRWSDAENADPGADVDDDIRIWISEVERLFFTLLRVIGMVKIVAFTPGTVSVDEVDSLNETVQLVKFSQVQVYTLN